MRIALVFASCCVTLGLIALCAANVARGWNDQSLTSLKSAAALETPVVVNFDEAPLKSAIESLCRRANIDVYWDASCFADDGVASNETVALVVSEPLSLRRALALVLEPCYLKYELFGERQLRIVSRKQWNDEMVTVAYDARPVLKALPAGFDLPGYIQQTVAPGQWQTGDARVAGYLLLVDGELQVTQRRSAQQDVAALLARLVAPRE